MSVTKKIPMRQCVGCREMKPKKEMIRVLKTADEGIIIDKTGKKNGRGAYICSSKECLEKAVKNHGLESSFKMKISDDVYELLKGNI
ncbi:MAG: YlxR family protein [Lachnospiraceae bacterium]|nr:YlxR family protein [Lachnospiraceae bacterium]